MFRRFAWLLACSCLCSFAVFAQEEGKKKKKGEVEGVKPADKAGKKKIATGTVIGDNKATPVERLKLAKGFRAELLHSVPAGEQGSWVNLCVDPKGRIIASDQYGGLYRFAPPAPGKPLDPATIEPVPAEIRAVNGMLWAFDALYVGVNDYEKKIPSGLYRLTDSNGDDKLDRVELLREITASGDHGVHAVVPTPDGKALYLVTGNSAKPTSAASSRVPLHWGDDHLLPRMPDGRGFMRDVLAPGGIIYRVSPDGKEFEIFSSGFRNIFDASVNRAGDLFTYDADMEYDFNTSWYRPTRICQATSGSEWGWRNGAGKWPEWYPDNLGPTINIGPGSPTGTTFGYGAKFPAKYQNALFALDWSWGKMYAIHLTPDGAGYTAEKEEFVSGAPLPLTDAVIHPGDGAMYFAIGGRKTQSGLYRVIYVGTEATAPIAEQVASNPARDLRMQLEAFHGHVDSHAVADAWPHLNHADRFVRWAARTSIEHQPLAEWKERVFSETDPAKQVHALMAAARVGGIDPLHRKPSDPPVDLALCERILAALAKIDPAKLDFQERLTLVRTYEIALNRFGRPDQGAIDRAVAQLDPLFPVDTREMNWLLCETLSYLQAPNLAAKGVALLENSATQEEQIEYARSLRMLRAGWNDDLRTRYFRWFHRAANFKGGASFEKFMEFIRTDALATLTAEEKTRLAAVLAEEHKKITPVENFAAMFAGRARTPWTLEQLTTAAGPALKGRDFANGRKMFAAAACFTCHRFANEGGMTGPDLTSAGRRYALKDFFDHVLNPSKDINEQFVPMEIITEDDEVIRGVIVNLNGDTIQVNTDPTDPNQRKSIDRKTVVSVQPSKISPMPTGLFELLTQDEILDLAAYVTSGGDAKHEAFRK